MPNGRLAAGCGRLQVTYEAEYDEKRGGKLRASAVYGSGRLGVLLIPWSFDSRICAVHPRSNEYSASPDQPAL